MLENWLKKSGCFKGLIRFIRDITYMVTYKKKQTISRSVESLNTVLTRPYTCRYPLGKNVSTNGHNNRVKGISAVGECKTDSF